MKFRRFSALVAALGLLSMGAWAQNATLTGRVPAATAKTAWCQSASRFGPCTKA